VQRLSSFVSDFIASRPTPLVSGRGACEPPNSRGRGNRVHRGKGVNLEADNSLGGSRLGEPSAFLQRRARLLFGDGEQTNMNLANLLV